MTEIGFVELEFKNQTIIVDKKGAILSDYRTKDSNKRVIFGYGKERSKMEVSQGYVLSPFPGRCEKGKYSFEGKNYTMKAPAYENLGNAIHGFVFCEIWECEKKKIGNSNEENAIVCNYKLKKEEFEEKGYPFSLEFEIIYQLIENGLIIKSKVKNIGQENAPFGIGFHPFFVIENENKDQKVDNFKLEIPAKKLVEFDSGLKPTGKLIDINSSEIIEKNLSFETSIEDSKKKIIGEVKLDHCFTELKKDSNGISRTFLVSENYPKDSRKIEIWQEAESFPYIQVYSYDFDSSNKRAAIAIEPESCCGFAFNIPEVGLRVLKPNDEFFGNWGVKFENF